MATLPTPAAFWLDVYRRSAPGTPERTWAEVHLRRLGRAYLIPV